MAFSESLKLKLKRRAHFRCCLCHELGIEIHHIIPQQDNGPDTEANAVPLCPTCHERYGANPTKRKFLREARDFWYQLCDDSTPRGTLKKIEDAVARTATKRDLEALRLQLVADLTRATPRSITKKRATATVSEIIRFLCEYECRTTTMRALKERDRYDAASFMWDELIWDEEPLVHFRTKFLQRFGWHCANLLAINCMDTAGISLHPWFTEDEFGRLFNLLTVSTALIMTSKAVLTTKPIFDIWIWNKQLIFKKLSKRDPFKLKPEEMA
jgi:hypothetical protein